MIKLDEQFREKMRQGYGDVQLGKPLPWTIFDVDGRLLMRRGAIIGTPEQLALLAEHAVYCFNSESTRTPATEEQRKAPFFIIGEMMGRLSAFLTAVANQQVVFLERLYELSTGIQVMCAEDADAALAAIHLDNEGKYAVRHLIHSALLVELVAYRLGYVPDDRHRMVCASLTANVGMMELQERLLKEGELTSEQRHEINHHPERSVAMLRRAGVHDESWLEYVLQHHERMDGSGYPNRLQGDKISVPARLIALADVYHAKISNRNIRTAMLPTHALRQLFLGHEKGTDQDMAKVFIKELGVYPPGGFVKLANGEVAVVTHRAQDGISPRVASVLTPRGVPYPHPLPRDTSKNNCGIRETAERDESILLTSLLPLWGY